MKGHLEKAKRKSTYIIFVLIFSRKSVCFILDSAVYITSCIFREEQLKELRATEVTVLLENDDRVQVLTLPRRRSLSYRNQSIDLHSKSRTGFYMITASILKGLSLTQTELRNTVDEVDWETIDETKSSFQQGLNSSFDCLPLLNLDAKLSISGSFKQIFLKLNWCDFDYFSFFSELWVKMVQNYLTEILQTWPKYQMVHCDKTIFWSTFG